HRGDADQRQTLITESEETRDPVDTEVGLTVDHLLLRNDIRSARQDLNVQVFVLVVALVQRNEVAGELGLGHPLELELDLVGRSGGLCSNGGSRGGGGSRRGRRLRRRRGSRGWLGRGRRARDGQQRNGDHYESAHLSVTPFDIARFTQHPGYGMTRATE